MQQFLCGFESILIHNETVHPLTCKSFSIPLSQELFPIIILTSSFVCTCITPQLVDTVSAKHSINPETSFILWPCARPNTIATFCLSVISLCLVIFTFMNNFPLKQKCLTKRYCLIRSRWSRARAIECMSRLLRCL